MKPVIKKLNTPDIDDFMDLIRVFADVFDMNNFQIPDKNYLQQLLAKGDFFVFVALVNGKVVGGLTSYTLQQYYSKLALMYIYDLAVKMEYQRQGIGRTLISGITDYCKEIGIVEVFVQADEEDKEAIEFYHSTGATAEKVLHFNYLLNLPEFNL